MTFMSEYRINEPRRLGRALREERRKRGLTQVVLADSAAVSRGWLVRFEQGHGSAEIATVFKVMNALGLTMTLTERQTPDAEAQVVFDDLFND